MSYIDSTTRSLDLFNPAAIDEMARRLLEQLPAGIKNMDADLRKNLKAGLSQVLRDMDLVTREEYELQTRVLARTREKLEQLEQRASALERKLEKGLAKGQKHPGGEAPTD